MSFAMKAGASALAVALAAGAASAQDLQIENAEWWQNAGQQFDGVTLHGVTEGTPPSNFIKDVLAPEVRGEDRHQGRDRDHLLGPDVRQGDQGHGGRDRHL